MGTLLPQPLNNGHIPLDKILCAHQKGGEEEMLKELNHHLELVAKQLDIHHHIQVANKYYGKYFTNESRLKANSNLR